MEMKKLLALGIIFLFIGIAIAPSINSSVVKTLVNKENTSVSLTEKSNVSVQFFTLHGVETIEREISFQDSDNLSKLMDGSDVDAIASELTHLGLVPPSMNSELKNLINSEYSKKGFAKYSDRLTKLFVKEGSEIKQNFLCVLKGEAHTIEGRNLRAELLGFAAFPGIFLLILDFVLQATDPNYPIIIPGAPYFGFGPLGLLGLTIVAAVLGLQYISDVNPIKLSLLFQDILLSRAPYGMDVNVNTTGICGKWSLYGHHVDLHLVGFFGIIVSFFNPHSTNEKLIGSSMYVWAQN
jgi:hypothetical protein